jgi:hypothetical protein
MVTVAAVLAGRKRKLINRAEYTKIFSELPA